MDIPTIKTRLTITQVDHYNLRPDRNHRLLCPFHEDKTPSLQVYPDTKTFCSVDLSISWLIEVQLAFPLFCY